MLYITLVLLLITYRQAEKFKILQGRLVAKNRVGGGGGRGPDDQTRLLTLTASYSANVNVQMSKGQPKGVLLSHCNHN